MTKIVIGCAQLRVRCTEHGSARRNEQEVKSYSTSIKNIGTVSWIRNPNTGKQPRDSRDYITRSTLAAPWQREPTTFKSLEPDDPDNGQLRPPKDTLVMTIPEPIPLEGEV